MEDEERQKKLEAGKAKLAEYRQRKAHADSQKKQKKKKKKKADEDSGGDSQGKVEDELDRSVEGQELTGGGGGNKDQPTTEFSFTKTLRSGETVRHDQTYKIEPESEISTTAEDYSSEVNGCYDETVEHPVTSPADLNWEEVEYVQQLSEGNMEDSGAARTQTEEELTRELDKLKAAFGAEGVQQLQDFEAALKQRDGIITQLTSNLQQAREEKDEIMKEFLALTDESKKLHLQFQQLQAGETLRNTSHSSTAADLFQARQQLLQNQQQLEEQALEVRKHQDRSREQLELICQLEHRLSEMERTARRAEESFLQKIKEKELLVAEQEKVLFSQKQWMEELTAEKESFAQTLTEKSQLILKHTAIITEHERSLALLREELTHAGRSVDHDEVHLSKDKELMIADLQRVLAERDHLVTQLEEELQTSGKRQFDLQEGMTAKESELKLRLQELEDTKSELKVCQSDVESCKLDLEKGQMELESCKKELAASKEKERKSSSEIMQLMGTVEALQKRCHQGSVSDSELHRRMQEENAKSLEFLRAELDEQYGQQIVQMKQEINLQHAARLQQMAEQHYAEIELLKVQKLPQRSTDIHAEVEALNSQMKELKETLQRTQTMHNQTTLELRQVLQEKFNLQAQVKDLLRDRDEAEAKLEQVSHQIISQESKELLQLQKTIQNLRSELSAAQEAIHEAEAKHESEITNYKIKLEMLEREKDAVLDRMAESQEAELERLRTQLLFSHEEELTNLREELQRESYLNTENLLKEAAVKHKAALEELRRTYSEELLLLQKEKESFAVERDELLHQILALKEDLKMALHSTKADDLVEQLQELQVELEELRKGAQEHAQLQEEVQTLLNKVDTLKKQTKDKEDFWERKLHLLELEKENLIKDLQVKQRSMETLMAENNQMQQHAAELREEVEKQKTTFSFAEKNFEVNYQELKEEYTCLIETKTQLEEKTRRETLEFEARIALLQSQIQELQRSSREDQEESETEGETEKESSELMEKLHVTLNEKRSLEERLSEVTEQFVFTQKKVQQLEEELQNAREENVKVINQNESLQKERAQRQEMMRKQLRGKAEEKSAEHQAAEPQRPSEDLHLHVQSLQEEIKTLQFLAHAAETERDRLRQALELHRLSQTPSPALLSSEERPVEGQPPPHKPLGGGSNRRKRRQRSKQERRAAPPLREEEDGAAGEEMQPQMHSQVMSCSQERAGEEDFTDGYQGDGERIGTAVSSHGGRGQGGSLKSHREEMEKESCHHGECRLQMEAQRISLSQIHAAQLELLQEETTAQARSLEWKPQNARGPGDPEEPKVSRYQSLIQAVTDESNQIFQSFQKIFGEDLLERVNMEALSLILEERPETKESASIILEAQELCRVLLQVKEKIAVEHRQLSQLRDLLRAEGNKISALQTAYDDLRTSSEKEISELRSRVRTSSISVSTDLEEQTCSSTSLAVDLQQLRAEAQEKQLQLEERHRQEMERLRSYYQQQAAETEERYATELFMLQRQLQEADAYARASESSLELENKEVLKDLYDEELSDTELLQLSRSSGVTGQLQTLRKALYNKYVQEVAALREQHSDEMRRLREEQRSKRQDLNGVVPTVRSESFNVVDHLPEEEELQQQRLEEEVAKAIVQMSVEFAQKTELTRLERQVSRTNTSMQTQLGEQDQEMAQEQTPRASRSARDWLEAADRERLEQELEERNTEIQRLKEELQKAGRGAKQPLMKREDEEEQVKEEVDGSTLAGGADLSLRDDGESSDGDSERYLLQKLNKKLSQELLDVLKTTAAAEETIQLHLQSLSSISGDLQRTFSSVQRETWNRANAGPSNDSTAGSVRSSEGESEEVWSGALEDEGLEVSQQMTDSLVFASALQNQEHLMSISSRLQTALEKMLMVITNTTNQLEHARMTQTELMRESFRHNQEISELLEKQEELQERLSEEAQAREQLALELQRAEGLIDGYTDERASLEELLRQKEELQKSLEEELQQTNSQLQELEQNQLQLQGERELLSRQQDAMREEAGPRELCLVEAAMVAAPEEDLLEETEKLMKEKVEVQRQAEKENTDLLKQVKLLEAELEEQVNRMVELEHAQTVESSDLRQQVQALEKQLEKNRKFLDEQAVDREHERDFFQQEIQKLEQQLRSPQKLQMGSEQRNQEVEQLTSQLKEKADWCSELLLGGEQLRRELGERDEEIDKLESRIRDLEQALLASAETLEKVEHKKHHAPPSETRPPTLEAQLQTEREAVERKEKEICNLEEQLEQFKEELENKSEEVQQLHMQLEIQRKEMSSQQQYLETRESMLQVMEQKDREIELLKDQISKRQHTGSSCENKEVDERNELLKDLESQVEYLRSEQERLKRNNEEELDQLNQVIEKLQQELVNLEPRTAAEEDEDHKKKPDGVVWASSQEERDEMKQRKDQATKELDALKTEHSKLLETYSRLKAGAEALAETANLADADDDLEEALREKTAGLVVLQAQVQALEQSAASRVEELGLRIQELEDLLSKKNSEIEHFKLLVKQTQSCDQDLQQKVSDLEEKLREKVAEALVSKATLEAFQQQQQQQRVETSAQELHRSTAAFQLPSFPPLGFSESRQPQQMSTGKVTHLTQKLRDLEVGLSGMQKDQELQKELLSSSEEVVNQYERRLEVLMDLLGQMKSRTRWRTPEETPSDEQPPPSHLLQEVKSEAAAAKEQLEKYKEMCSKLEQELREKSSTMQTLQIQMQQNSTSGGQPEGGELRKKLMEAEAEAAAAKEELNSSREGVEKLQELLQEREMTIAHLKGELFQVKASEDAADTTKLYQELQEVRRDAASTKEEVNFYRTHTEKLQEDLRVREASSSQLSEEFQELRRNVNVTKEELNNYKQENETLLEELQVRELSISSLKEQLQEVQTALMKTTESGSQSPSPSPQPSSCSSQPKRKGGKHLAGKVSSTREKPSASKKNSAASSTPSTTSPSPQPSVCSEQQPSTVMNSSTQTEALQTPQFRADSTSAAKEEMEEVIGGFQEKIDQMQELHAAEILDMEARHISESENLRRDLQALEDECKALKAVIDRLRSAEAPASRQDRSTSLLKDGYASDSSSDYSQRTSYELLQQEFRTTPEGARREGEDPLPDRIKSLIREVHQEGMQVLSLSELPLSEGEPGRHTTVPGWLKERDALLATLESLKALITQIQTQTAGGADWRAGLLDAVRQVFVKEKSLLKNAGLNQLGLLDTSDAVIHLNHLELRLAEQDAQHRDAMASLLTAERASLLSEIQQLHSQLHQEEGGDDGGDRPRVEELKAELCQTKLELEAELKVQQKHLKELEGLRAELSQKTAEVEELNEQLMDERKRSRDLQWAVEKEKCRTERDEENKREEVEDLQLSLEELRNRVVQLTQSLEQQQQTSSALQQQAEQEYLHLRRQLQELHVQLDTERAKSQELTSALGRERELRITTSSDSAPPNEEQAQDPSAQEESLLERLQRELDEKHAQVVNLLTQVEVQRLQVVQKEEELTLVNQRSKRCQEAQREAEVQLERREAELSDVQELLRTERDSRRTLEVQKEKLEERLDIFEGRAQAVQYRESTDRTQDWVLHQRGENAQSGTKPSPHAEGSPSGHTCGPDHISGPGHTSDVDHTSGSTHGPWRTVDKIVGKLHLVSSKICNLASRNTGRLSAEEEADELSWIQSNVDDVLAVLQQSPGLLSFPENASLLAGGTSSSSNTLTERLLRQNAELTGFVSRLTEEKNDLRNRTLRLEEELRRHRQAGFGSGYSSRRGADPAGSRLSQEREAWNQEKIRLEKALLLAHSQISRLRGEIRSNAVQEITGPEADNAAMKRMYGRYLRSESFRKALIYQKKYLLLLLGGFQECEEATLFLLTRMGGRPTLDPLSQRRRGLTRFRSAVRVAIALSRMRFLVKRWHRAAGMNSAPSSKNGAGGDVRDSSFLHPGGAEVPRERGGVEGVSSSRGRSGSPRSGVSSSHHRFHAASDHAALTCSHLQSYDPDRALSDYISRLEALQRRLGSVASGSSSYAQMHHGLRR